MAAPHLVRTWTDEELTEFETIELPFSYEVTSAKATLLGATVGAARPKA